MNYLAIFYPLSGPKNHKRKFQPSWIKTWSWLAYSKKEDCVNCKFCFLFNEVNRNGVGKGSHKKPGTLTNSSFRNWKKATEKFAEHCQSDIHKKCTMIAESFYDVATGKINDIATPLDKNREKQIHENRAALIPIIETILFCGENELPLRGDKDSGVFTLEKPKVKDGKFRALLRFRVKSGDFILKQHIENCKKNASYLSPTIQNEIIDLSAKIVLERLVKQINSADCFAFLADGTTDILNVEQMSLCARYVIFDDEEKPMLREDFLCLSALHDLGAENISKVLLEKLEDIGLDMEKCVGC